MIVDGGNKAGVTVSFQNVTKAYGGVSVLKGLTLSVKSGEFLTLLGGSGSGKTTALKLLAGFDSTSSGSILMDGRNVSAMPPEKRNIGMVFQNYSLFPHLSVEANIAYPLRMRRISSSLIQAKVERSLELVRMLDYRRRMPRELSGGQQQRAALARAIVYEPPLLLMDEPLGALDQRLRDDLQLEIRELHRKLGCTIIFVTHDQREALILSDRIAVIRRGELEQIGTPSDLYDRPSSEYIASFFGKANILSTAVSDDTVKVSSLGVYLPRPRGLQGAVVAMVRPEKIGLGEVVGQQSVKGYVQKTIFLGDCHVVEVSVNGGTITAQISRNERGGVSVGDEVTVSFKSSDIQLLPA